MENIIGINEIDEMIKEIFSDTLVKSVETTFEKIDNKSEYKLIISIHQLTSEKSVILHTKLVFFVDEQKQVLINRTFSYLYDINCHYKIVTFSNVSDLKNKILKIVINKRFGKDMISLSDFLVSPVSLLNSYLSRENITDLTIYDFNYEPKFKIRPCEETDFDFKVNIDNKYKIEINIVKIPTEKTYRFRYKYLDKTFEKTYNNIQPIPSLIGKDLIDIFKEIN
jgi:hypothetical protein